MNRKQPAYLILTGVVILFGGGSQALARTSQSVNPESAATTGIQPGMRESGEPDDL